MDTKETEVQTKNSDEMETRKTSGQYACTNARTHRHKHTGTTCAVTRRQKNINTELLIRSHASKHIQPNTELTDLTFSLQLFDTFNELRYGCRDVRQFDNVSLGRFGQFTQIRQLVGDALMRLQIVAEMSNESTSNLTPIHKTTLINKQRDLPGDRTNYHFVRCSTYRARYEKNSQSPLI